MTKQRLGMAIAAGATLMSMVGGWGAALAIQPQPTPRPGLSNAIAQRMGTCRATIAQIAVHAQPNTMSAVVGTIPAEGVMMLGTGRGEGWIQIQQPMMGWVDTSFLIGNDNTPCPPGFTVVQAPSPAPFPAPMPAPAAPAPQTPAGMTRCQVVPANGLVVRNQPVIAERTAVGNIANGVHNFSFTDRTRTTVTPEGRRDWIYITAPQEGWISPGFTDGGVSNLAGPGCP